jgi:ADP-ribose pyrophosphatase YjhB (NUDIX family)
MKKIYCIKCGDSTKKIGKSLFICLRCDFHYYENPRPTNAVILENKNGEILLVNRAHPPKKGWWDLPGGFIGFNESFEEGARREIKEELGISVSNFRYVNSHYNLYLYKGLYYHTLCVNFAAKLPHKKIIPRDDVASIRFFSKDNIPFKKIAFAAVKKGLEGYLLSLHQPKRP